MRLNNWSIAAEPNAANPQQAYEAALISLALRFWIAPK
jgi:hypothetical protein